MIYYYPTAVDELFLYLYCSDAPQKHSIGLTIHLNSSWLSRFCDSEIDNDIVVGLTLTAVDIISGDFVIPRLLPEFFLSTLFVPRKSFLAFLKMSGYISRIKLV